MKVYLVSGAVRDAILDVPVKDRDWVVVGATHEQMLEQGYTMADPEFPVYHHPQTGEEYALARKEQKTAAGYRGFELIYTPDVTLAEDLQRRDLTINAMAQDFETGEIIDPFNGQEDLHDGFLRHVSHDFVDDPIRLLRIARFAARFGVWGFRVAHGTHALLKKMVRSSELNAIVPERLWQETERALADSAPDRYFHVLNQSGALAVLFPELAVLFMLPEAHQKAQGLSKLALAAKTIESAESRCAILFGQLTVEAFDKVVVRMPMPKRFQQITQQVIHAQISLGNELSDEQVLNWVKQQDGFKKTDRFTRICQIIKVIKPAVIHNIEFLQRCQEALLPVSVKQLDITGLKGAQIGEKLDQARREVIASVKKEVMT